MTSAERRNSCNDYMIIGEVKNVAEVVVDAAVVKSDADKRDKITVINPEIAAQRILRSQELLYTVPTDTEDNITETNDNTAPHSDGGAPWTVGGGEESSTRLHFHLLLQPVVGSSSRDQAHLGNLREGAVGSIQSSLMIRRIISIS